MRLHHVQVACPPGGEAAARLRELGFDVDESQRTTFPGHLRLHTADPHGNRVEVLEVG